MGLPLRLAPGHTYLAGAPSRDTTWPQASRGAGCVSFLTRFHPSAGESVSFLAGGPGLKPNLVMTSPMHGMLGHVDPSENESESQESFVRSDATDAAPGLGGVAGTEGVIVGPGGTNGERWA